MRKSPFESAGRALNARLKRVAVLGLGLMGGSLGLALRKNVPGISVAGYARRKESLSVALDIGAIDEAFDSPEDAVRGADIAVFCTPVLSIPDLARACRGGFGSGAIVTDVGSTKAVLARRMPPLCRPAVFIGSHPIAGSEQSGLDAARADLYEGCVTVIAPQSGAGGRTVARLAAFWKAAGASPLVMTPAAHDRMIAATSHLPHLASVLLTLAVGRKRTGAAGVMCGSGFRDVSRLAGGSPEMWRDIIATNGKNIARELSAFREETGKLIGIIGGKNPNRALALLEKARSTRRGLVRTKQ